MYLTGFVLRMPPLCLAQGAFPLIFRSIHAVNVSYVVDLAHRTVVRPLLDPALGDGIHFHSCLEELHQHVDRGALPEELGGTAGAFSNEECLEALDSLEDYFRGLGQLRMARRDDVEEADQS